MVEAVPDHILPPAAEWRARFEAALAVEHGLSLEGALRLGEGYLVSALLLADGTTVARIPKHEIALDGLLAELDALALLDGVRLPFDTPHEARGVSDATGLVGALHRLVDGIPFRDRIEQVQASGEWHHLAEDMGAALAALHALPIEPFMAAGLDRWSRMTGEWDAAARPVLGADGAAWIDASRRHVEELAPASGRRVFTHGDLWPANVVVDSKDRLVGLIDFGFAAIADPAWDFRTFERWLGVEFASMVVQAYEAHGGVIDEHLLERARWFINIDELSGTWYDALGRGQLGANYEHTRARVDEWVASTGWAASR